MKSRFNILVFLMGGILAFAQNNTVNGKDVGKFLGGTETTDFSSRALFNKSDLFGKSLNNTTKIEGSALLFEGWSNNGLIIAGGQNYRLNNLNYDINQDAFMSKFNEDSTFVFDFSNIDKIVINNKEFKQFYNPALNKNKVYEVIHQSRNYSLLKGYSITVIESSPDPMLHRPNAKIRKKSDYFLMKNGSFEPFKWNKKSIVNLVNAEKRDDFVTYLKNNDLSLKEESDVSLGLKYFSDNN